MNTVEDLPFGELTSVIVWPKGHARDAATRLCEPSVVQAHGARYLVGKPERAGSRVLSFGSGTRVLSFSEPEARME